MEISRNNIKSIIWFLCCIILGMFICPNTIYAQQEKSIKESWNDLKKSFKSNKLLLYPAADTNKPDFVAFRDLLHQHKKVNGSALSIQVNGILMNVLTNQDLSLLWISMPREIRNRYRLGKRDENDIIAITDLEEVESNLTRNGQKSSERKPTGTETRTYGETNWSSLPLPYKKNTFIPLTKTETACKANPPKTPLRIAVAPFFISASYNPGGHSGSTADSIINRLGRVACFATFPEYIYYVPGGCQVIVTGDVKDYYTSEKKMGKPRLKWLVELRKASDFSILQSKEFSIEGDLYKGMGANIPFEKIWDNLLQQTVSWIHSESEELAKIGYATEAEVAILDTSLLFRTRVKTESMLESQQRYNEAKMARNRKQNIGLSEYYNDTAYRNTLPKIPYDEFIEYTIDGKKYQFFENAKKLEQQAFLNIIQGRSLAGGVDMKIAVSFSTIVGDMNIGMFDPSHFPTLRRFYFGSNPKADSRVQGGYEKVYCFAALTGGFKEDKFTMKHIPTEKVLVVGTNLTGQEKSNNVLEGFIQILYFETGMYGVLEAMFEFSTKAMTDKNGKTQPPKKVQGRFRVRGNISPPVEY